MQRSTPFLYAYKMWHSSFLTRQSFIDVNHGGFMNRCSNCGRYGNWLGYLCDTCRQTEVLNERNKIDKDRLRSEEEQRKRDREREEREQRNHEEQLRQERERDERKLEQERKRDEQNQKLREEQLRFEQERSKQEREDRLREIEAQEEANQIQREKFENEKREKEAKAWKDRTSHLDSLSDAEIKNFFENEADERERDYLKQRYRKCISSEEYLEFIKNEDKFLTKKKIREFIKTHSTDESLEYVFSIDTHWYEEIIERENFLKEFPEMNFEISSELEEKIQNALNSKERQKILRMNANVIRFKKMSSVDKQIYFREYIQKKCEEFFPETDFDNDEGFMVFWMLNPSLRISNDNLSENIIDSYQLFSLLEPLYIESLNNNEKKEYFTKKQQTENAMAEKKRKAKELAKIQLEQKRQYEKQIEEYRHEFNEKWKENEDVVKEYGEITRRREERALLYEKSKKSRKRTLKLGCILPFVILFLMGIIGNIIINYLKIESIILLGSIIIALLLILIPIRIILLSLKIRRLRKEETVDETKQNAIAEKNKQLINKINELQKILPKTN